jgi:tetratricopeptide (TPR) repeat protein
MSEDPGALVTQARAKQLEGDIAGALSLYQRAADLAPSDGHAHFGVGTCAQLLGQAERALAAYEASLPTFPDHPGITTRMAHLLRELGRLDEALAMYEQARVLCQDDVTIPVGHSQTLTLLGENELALAALTPGPWEAAGTRLVEVQRTQALLGLGRLDEAESVARALSGNSTQELVVRGILESDIAAARWELEDAEGHIAAACQADPLNPMLHLRHAATLLALLRPTEAIDALARRAALVPVPRGSDIRPRATQGLFADIANELRLEPESLAAARSALQSLDAPAAARAVRETPGSLAAACALLVALRRTDLLRTDFASSPTPVPDDEYVLEQLHGPSVIPHHVIQAWFGSPPPPEVESTTASWRRRSGWRYTRLDDRSAVRFLRDEVGQDAVDAFLRARHPAARADLIRLAWLAGRGGVWADVDDACRAPVDPLVDGRTLVVWQEDRGNLANDFMAAAPGHPAIIAARDEAIRCILDTYTESTWLATGPGLVTRQVGSWLAQHLETLGTTTVILDRHELVPYVAPGLPLRYKSEPGYWLHTESRG